MLGAMGTKVNQKRRGLCSHEASGLGEETHYLKSHSLKKLQTMCKHSGEEQQNPRRGEHSTTENVKISPTVAHRQGQQECFQQKPRKQ